VHVRLCVSAARPLHTCAGALQTCRPACAPRVLTKTEAQAVLPCSTDSGRGAPQVHTPDSLAAALWQPPARQPYLPADQPASCVPLLSAAGAARLGVKGGQIGALQVRRADAQQRAQQRGHELARAGRPVQRRRRPVLGRPEVGLALLGRQRALRLRAPGSLHSLSLGILGFLTLPTLPIRQPPPRQAAPLARAVRRARSAPGTPDRRGPVSGAQAPPARRAAAGRRPPRGPLNGTRAGSSALRAAPRARSLPWHLTAGGGGRGAAAAGAHLHEECAERRLQRGQHALLDRAHERGQAGRARGRLRGRLLHARRDRARVVLLQLPHDAAGRADGLQHAAHAVAGRLARGRHPVTRPPAALWRAWCPAPLLLPCVCARAQAASCCAAQCVSVAVRGPPPSQELRRRWFQTRLTLVLTPGAAGAPSRRPWRWRCARRAPGWPRRRAPRTRAGTPPPPPRCPPGCAWPPVRARALAAQANVPMHATVWVREHGCGAPVCGRALDSGKVTRGWRGASSARRAGRGAGSGQGRQCACGRARTLGCSGTRSRYLPYPNRPMQREARMAMRQGLGGSRGSTRLGARWQVRRFYAARELTLGSHPARSVRQPGLARIGAGSWCSLPGARAGPGRPALRGPAARRRTCSSRARRDHAPYPILSPPHLLQQAAGAGALRRGRVEQRAHVARQRARRAQLLAALHGLRVARAEARHRLRRQRGGLHAAPCGCHTAAPRRRAARRRPARRSPARASGFMGAQLAVT